MVTAWEIMRDEYTICRIMRRRLGKGVAGQVPHILLQQGFGFLFDL